MAFQCLLNGVDYTDHVDWRSLNISEVLQVRGFTCQFDVLINAQSIAVPLGGWLVQIYRDGTIEFGGRVGSVNQTQPGVQTNLAYKVTCVDFTIDMDMTILRPRQYGILSAGDIIRSVVGLLGRGFTSNGVDDGIVVNQQFIEYDTPSALITKIADSIEYHWYVDYNRDVQFYFLRDRVAPIGAIDIDADVSTYYDLTLDEQWEQVKNRLYLTGAKLRSTNYDNISATADGQTRFFPLNYEPFQLSDVTVTVDGVAQSLFLDSITGQAGDGETAAGKAYVCIDNWGVRFPDNSPPAPGAAVQINTLYVIPSVVIVQDSASIATMQARENVSGAPSTGVHESKFDVPELRVISQDTIWQYGQILLLRYAKIIFQAKFKSYVQGWHPGQYLQMTSAAGKRNFDQTMYITRVTKTVRTTTPQALFDYEIEASSTPFPG